MNCGEDTLKGAHQLFATFGKLTITILIDSYHTVFKFLSELLESLNDAEQTDTKYFNARRVKYFFVRVFSNSEDFTDCAADVLERVDKSVASIHRGHVFGELLHSFARLFSLGLECTIQLNLIFGKTKIFKLRVV